MFSQIGYNLREKGLEQGTRSGPLTRLDTTGLSEVSMSRGILLSVKVMHQGKLVICGMRQGVWYASFIEI
ncbi:MAG: hypothetical protein KatS3mg112_1391 [Thermogutta sp.]|nr:MAG: hypothetical protein KatS3mg112_1391 [Thermogutta sp.]